MPSFVTDNHANLQRRYAGNVIFYQFLDRYRTPSYLHRNINQFLKYHQKKLQARAVAPDTPVRSMDSEESAGARRRAWDPKEIQQIIDQRKFNDRGPCLKVNVTAIKDRRKSFKPPTPSSTPNDGTNVKSDGSTRAICGLTIWQGSDTDILVQDDVYCTIINKSDPESGERYAEVHLEEPFIISAREFVPKHVENVTALRYSMQITFQAANMQTMWPPIDLGSVGKPKLPAARREDGGMDIFPFFVSSYPRLPYVPTNDQERLLEIHAQQDHKQLKPKLDIKFEAEWIEAATPLEYFNQRKKRESRKAKQQEEANGKRQISVEPPTDLNVLTKWQLTDKRWKVNQSTFSGYVCPLCNNRRFGSTDLYWFHLVHSHDIFRFNVTSNFPSSTDRASHIEVTVNVSIKEPGTTGKAEDSTRFQTIEQRGEHPSEIELLNEWKDFFDLHQYLLAEDTKHLNRRAGRALQGVDRTGSDSSRPTPVPKDLSRAAELIPDIPPAKRRKYPVPAAPPGVTFFSLRVKRPLKEGELLSESDDDIDDAAALQKHCERIDTFGDLTAAERLFLKRHDRHMLGERINSKLHYREALIRFCRINRSWLRRPEYKREFAKKLTALQLEGIIKITQVFEYLKIIERRDREQDEAIMRQETGDTRKEVPLVAAATAGVIYATCALCDQPVRKRNELFQCSKLTCTRDFHRACLERLGRRFDNGDPGPKLCPDCRKGENKGPSSRTHGQTSATAVALDGGSELSPELEILDNFAEDQLEQLPNGKRLGPGDRESRYARPHGSKKARYLDDAYSGVQDSDGVDDDDDEPPTPDFPVGRDRMRRQVNDGQPSIKHHKSPGHSEHPRRDYAPENARLGRQDSTTNQGRFQEDTTRRHADQNYGDWERRTTEEAPRPRRPHEL